MVLQIYNQRNILPQTSHCKPDTLVGEVFGQQGNIRRSNGKQVMSNISSQFTSD